MWYWFYEIASVTLVIGLVALILWWAWRQETAGRFAKEKPKVKWWRTKDWPESTLEQRVKALEKTWDVYHGETTRLKLSTDSLPDTETPAEQGSTKTLSYSELFPASQGGTPKP